MLRYGYYFLATFGFKSQIMKPFVTYSQMIQFLMFIAQVWHLSLMDTVFHDKPKKTVEFMSFSSAMLSFCRGIANCSWATFKYSCHQSVAYIVQHGIDAQKRILLLKDDIEPHNLTWVFFVCLSQAIFLLVKDCYKPRLVVVYLLFQCIIFFILFANFALKTYWRKKNKSQWSSDIYLMYQAQALNFGCDWSVGSRW